MNRSEELCKLLGIEPKILYTQEYPCLDWCESEPCKCHGCQHQKGVNVVKEIYVDFAKPSNFVKLLEMKIFKTQTLLKNIMGWSFSLTRDIDDINSFVEAIENYIYELKEQDYYEIIEEIQQQAQATKWDY